MNYRTNLLKRKKHEIKSVLLIILLFFSVLSIFSVVLVKPVKAQGTDEYFIYSKYDPPGIDDVVAVGSYVEYYGVPEWGDEIQYIYFLSGTMGYKVRVWVSDGDGDGKIEPRQHPNHYISEFIGPIEPRNYEIVSSYDLYPYASGSGWHTEEFYIDSSGVYVGAYPNGIHKWDHGWNYIGKIANSPPERTESMAYNAADNIWYAGGRYRTIYELRDTDNDGSFLDESWISIFTYPTYGGDHHDGMEYIGGYLWISDMTSDVIGKWKYNPSSGIWEELRRFTYSELGDVEGMGFGANDHFWCGSGWGSSSYFYELGNEITKGYPIANAGSDIDAHPPNIAIEFDASGSHHTDPTKNLVLYEWDFENDGVWDYIGTELTVEHAYPAYYYPDGSIDWDQTAKDYTATLRVTDDSDPILQDTDTCIIHITAPPWKPVADPNGPYEGYQNVPVILDASGSYDPESEMFPLGHPWYETIAIYEWDLDHDGEFDDATGINPSWTWDNPGIYIIGLKVIDSQMSGPGGTIGPLDIDIRYASVIILEAGITIILPNEGEIFWIDAEPEPKMPVIKCQAELFGFIPDLTATTKFEWEAICNYSAIVWTPQFDENGNYISPWDPTHGYFPYSLCIFSHTFGPKTIEGGYWDIEFKNIICGGNLTIKVKAIIGGIEYKDSIKVFIRGRNPSREYIREILLDQQEPEKIILQAICYVESYFCQYFDTPWVFRPDYFPGIPLYGSPGGYGLMQMDVPPNHFWNPLLRKFDGKPTIILARLREYQNELMWNWQLNINEAKRKWQDTWKQTLSLEKRERNIYGSEVKSLTTDQRERNTANIYNSGQHYYEWDTQIKTWVPTGNSGQIYADTVMEIKYDVLSGNEPIWWNWVSEIDD